MSTPDASSHSRSASLSRSRARSTTPPPQPTTPLRPPSRSSLRSSHGPSPSQKTQHDNPLASLEPAFAELSDGMADLEANFMHLQLMHESLARFSECFASFLYGLNVNAFCVDFPEAPIPESFRRAQDNPAFTQPEQQQQHAYGGTAGADHDETFLTSDTSFVENPPASTASVRGVGGATPRGKSAGTRGARGASTRGGTTTRGGSTAGTGRGGASSTRGRASGLPRGSAGRGRAGYR